MIRISPIFNGVPVILLQRKNLKKNGIQNKLQMIEYIKEGDIFAIPGVYNYAHGCNCAGAMGKGIALQFKNKFPLMYKKYKLLCQKKEFTPGDVYDYSYESGHVYNLATQESWRSKAKMEYIKSSLIKMMQLAIQNQTKTIALPAIGAGLGGLKWNDIKSELNEISFHYPSVKLIVVESYKSK